uniref:MFS transporter n=1 Tax=Cyberlindnera americana TaxID=36016 RepID=A0A5P8N9A9_9ASCO|nr:MFS transporter [Cyberlindnera americana]
MSIKDWFSPKNAGEFKDTDGTNTKSSLYGKSSANTNVRDLESLSSDSTANEHIFNDPKVADYYRRVYEASNYECREKFDPEYTWTEEEERKVVWKCDWRVTFWAYIMFSALDFDRANISQALSDDMLGDLGLTTNDYNLGNTLFLVCFLGSELPSQLISKKIGAERWIPMQLTLWSAISLSQAAITNRTGFLITRALIGLFQGGFICDTCLWMSYFYTAKELPFRFALFYIANPLTDVLSALLGAGLLQIKTSVLPHGWQWLFLIEGAFTLLVGLASFFMMPASAVDTKTWFRPRGWFTDHEEKIVVNRVLRDDPSKGDLNNHAPVSLKELFRSLTDIDMLPIYLIRLFADLRCAPVKNYLTLTLKQLGFSTFHTNLLTIPQSVLTIFQMLFFSWVAERFQQRALTMALTTVWTFSFLVPLRYWSGSQVDIWPTYAILTLLLSYCPSWPITISWCSSNSNSVRSRAVSAALVNMFSQSASIIGSNIYRADDKPLYHRGNTQLIAINVAGIVICIFARYYYIWRNKKREAVWEKLTAEEQLEYIETTKDIGNKRLNFRFVY